MLDTLARRHTQDFCRSDQNNHFSRVELKQGAAKRRAPRRDL